MRPIVLALALTALVCSCKTENKPWMELYVGTYTEGTSEGIYTL